MNLRKILISLILLFWIFFLANNTMAVNIEMWNNDFERLVERVSINTDSVDDKRGIVEKIESLWVNLLWTFKVVIQWLLLLFIVYAWAMMIMSMWTNEEDLASAKRHIRYALIALVFINMPWTIYDALVDGWWEDITQSIWIVTDKTFGFINMENLLTIIWNIVQFIQVIIFFIAILLLSLSAIKLIMARWREDVIKEHKNNIFYSLLWLVFVWLIWLWKDIVFDWVNIQTKAKGFFNSMAEFILMFAWPIAIFFLIMAWYYFITANWDEDKIKKWKSIIVNVVLWFVILLMSYTFLLDLNDFNIND